MGVIMMLKHRFGHKHPDSIQLSDEEWKRITETFEHPKSDPGEALTKAVTVYHQVHDKGDRYMYRRMPNSQ